MLDRYEVMRSWLVTVRHVKSRAVFVGPMNILCKRNHLWERRKAEKGVEKLAGRNDVCGPRFATAKSR